MIVYGIPITDGGKVIGAVTATRTTTNLSDIISREIFGGAPISISWTRKEISSCAPATR